MAIYSRRSDEVQKKKMSWLGDIIHFCRVPLVIIGRNGVVELFSIDNSPKEVKGVFFLPSAFPKRGTSFRKEGEKDDLSATRSRLLPSGVGVELMYSPEVFRVRFEKRVVYNRLHGGRGTEAMVRSPSVFFFFGAKTD